MKPYLNLFAAMLLVGAVLSCSSDSGIDEVPFTPQNFNVKGKVEKGPFVSGSTITLQPMDSKMSAVGDLYTATIEDNAGTFSFGSKRFEQRYAAMTANGYFFNETTGSLSNGTLILRSVVDLSDNATVNVNILTHLKYSRIMNLVADGKSFQEANGQAQKELFNAFGLSEYASKDPASFSITSGTDEAAVLIAISSLILIDRSEAEITEYLAKLSKEFAENGCFSISTKATMDTDKSKLVSKLADIPNNIISRYADLDMSVGVKPLAQYIDWDNDGTAGNETLKDGETVAVSPAAITVPNNGGTYEVQITSPINVFLTQPTTDNGNYSITEVSFGGLYDTNGSQWISIEKTLNGNVLILKVGQLDSRATKTADVPLFDALGNTVATIAVTQDGNPNAEGIKLGEQGAQAVIGLADRMGDAFAYLNNIEQYYHYNKDYGSVNANISSSSDIISNAWENCYLAIRYLLSLQQADEQRYSVFQDPCNVLYAMLYYQMTTMWGNIPCMTTANIDDYSTIPTQSTQSTQILDNLASQLKTAISNLDEKKNESTKDANGFFLMSKDVARILLAQIYMYQDNCKDALPLLQKVISNGFYALDSSNYSDENTIGVTDSELIFVLQKSSNSRSSRSSLTISQPAVLPIMNYTDVMLLCAECLYRTGDTATASTYLNKVASAKGISVSSDVFKGITEAREKLLLYSLGNFQFMKRNGIAVSEYDIQSYQQLLPIPDCEICSNPTLSQNQGW